MKVKDFELSWKGAVTHVQVTWFQNEFPFGFLIDFISTSLPLYSTSDRLQVSVKFHAH